MNEPTALPAPHQPDASPEAPPPSQSPPSEPPRSRRVALPLLCAVGFLVLAGAIAYVWSNMVSADRLAAETQNYNAVNQRIGELEAKVNALDQRPPAVTPADLAKLSTRLDATDNRLASFDDRLNSLDGKLANQSQLASRLDAVSARIESLAARSQTGFDNLNQQLADVSSRATAAQKAAAGILDASKRIDELAKLQQAALALSIGRPLGDIPGAPPALSKYAHAPPPTEAQLRQSYPRAQAEALSRQQPENASAPLVDRMWERAQGLVTIRRGDDVVVGDTTSVALTQAQSALESGDLPGAVKAVKMLKGEPAKAMAGWLADAEALVNARAALAQMADQT